MSRRSRVQKQPPAAIRTPCIQVCVLDPESDLCVGCHRTLDEIAGWTAFSAEAREAVLAQLPARRGRIGAGNPDPG